MRTITQRTTLPFLMDESGAASLTEAVMTSPSPARSPRSPPRGAMQESLRAPLLSATSRIVRIPIIKVLWGVRCQETPVSRATLASSAPFSNVVQVLRLGRELGRAANDFTESPMLQLAQRAALDDAHDISEVREALLIVRVELLALTDDPLVLGMGHAAADLHHDGLRHLGRDDFADFLVLVARSLQVRLTQLGL